MSISSAARNLVVRAVGRLHRLSQASDADMHALIRRIIDDERGVSNETYARSYETIEQVRGFRRGFELSVTTVVPDYSKSVGCDLGCWFGLSTLLLHSVGARFIYGVDVNPQFIEQAENWRVRHDIDAIRFLSNQFGTVPLQSGTVDWVVISQVFCNADPAATGDLLREAVRILRPGGVLIFNDSNNPHCSKTLERLRAAYFRYEVGDGSIDHPDGPHLRCRRELIAKFAPDLDDERASTLARETAYLGGDRLRQAVADCVSGKGMPGNRFDPASLRPTCAPKTGRANGNITDPYRISADMEALGLRAQITCSPGDVTVRDNRVLYDDLRASQSFYVYGRKAN